MKQIHLIAHNLRSCHNVGSLLRTGEGLGIQKIWLTGYTPYPLSENDIRMPHEAKKISSKIQKTALGAEKMITWEHNEDILAVIKALKSDGFEIAALEQAADSIPLRSYDIPQKVALVVGREAEGIEAEVLTHCDVIVEIPMKGDKESFNVVQAAAMALYQFTAP